MKVERGAGFAVHTVFQFQRNCSAFPLLKGLRAAYSDPAHYCQGAKWANP